MTAIPSETKQGMDWMAEFTLFSCTWRPTFCKDNYDKGFFQPVTLQPAQIFYGTGLT